MSSTSSETISLTGSSAVLPEQLRGRTQFLHSLIDRLGWLGFSSMLTALFLTVFFFVLINWPMLADPDLGWHLRDAQWMLHHHAFLHQDVFSFTLTGHTWIDPEWLSELAFYGFYKLADLRGVEVLTILLLELLVLAVFTLSFLRTRNPRAAILAAAMFTLFASVSFAPRTQLFGWLACTVLVAVLHFYRSGQDLLWTLPPLFALWINLHGSWPVGLIVLILFILTGVKSFQSGSIHAQAWTSVQRRKLLIITALCAAAVFINPYGWHLVAYPFLIAGRHKLTLATVQEWQSLDFHGFRGRAVFLLVATFVFLKAFRSRTWSLNDVATLLFALLTAFTYSRFLLFAGIIFCPMLAEELDFLGRDKPAFDKPLLNFAIIALLFFFVSTHIPTQQALRTVSDTGQPGYPSGAVAFLRAHPATGPVFNDFNWGGYLILNLPTQPVFIDTRTDIFDDTGLFATYFDLLSIKSPIESFRNGQLRYVLIPPTTPLANLLARLPNWTLLYHDSTAVLYHRTS